MIVRLGKAGRPPRAVEEIIEAIRMDPTASVEDLMRRLRLSRRAVLERLHRAAAAGRLARTPEGYLIQEET